MRRVLEHDVAQVAGGLRRVNLAAEALLIQQGQQPRVVQMRVRHEHEFQLRRRNGDGNVLKHVSALLHAAVHQSAVPCDLQHGAAAGDFMVCPDEGKLHDGDLP